MQWTMDDQIRLVRFPVVLKKIFLYSKLFEPNVGSNRPLAEWVVGALPREIKRPECEVDQSPHLVPRLRMSGAIPPIPYTFMVYIGTTLPLFYRHN